MLRLFLLCFLFLSFIHSAAQNLNAASQSLVWHSNQLQEKHSGETVNVAVDIKTTTETIQLLYPNEMITFEIQSIEGEWQDVSADGQLLYSVLHNDTSFGEVTIQRSSGNLWIEVDFTENNQHGLHQVFEINSVNAQ